MAGDRRRATRILRLLAVVPRLLAVAVAVSAVAVACGNDDATSPVGQSTRTGEPELGSDPIVISAELAGSEEVAIYGDPDASGMATLSLEPTGQMCVVMNVAVTETASDAQVWEGDRSGGGEVFVEIGPPNAGNTWNLCLPIDDSQAEPLASSPASFYVQVDTLDFPDGALRGQLAGTTAS